MNDLMIDYFMAVATNLSFTKTSEELFVSQPAISKQISQLEKELGARLFMRNNKKTELTEVGRLYFDFFSKYKEDLISTRIEADRLLGKTKGIVRVGFLEGWDLFNIIPPMMERFKEEYPDSEIVINCCGVKELSKSLLTDSLDIAVTLKNSINMYREIECRDVAELKKVLLFSANHPLAGKEMDELSLKDFSEDTFIAPWEIVDKMIIETITSYTRPYGFIPKLTFVKNHESMITCVRNNMGVTIVDEWVWAKGAADLRWFSFNASDIVTVARNKSVEREAVKKIRDILIEIIEGNTIMTTQTT